MHVRVHPVNTACEVEALGMVMCCEWYGSMSCMVVVRVACVAVKGHLHLMARRRRQACKGSMVAMRL